MKNISTRYFVEAGDEQFEASNLAEARALARIRSLDKPTAEVQLVRVKTVMTAKNGVLTEVKAED